MCFLSFPPMYVHNEAHSSFSQFFFFFSFLFLSSLFPPSLLLLGGYFFLCSLQFFIFFFLLFTFPPLLYVLLFYWFGKPTRPFFSDPSPIPITFFVVVFFFFFFQLFFFVSLLILCFACALPAFCALPTFLLFFLKSRAINLLNAYVEILFVIGKEDTLCNRCTFRLSKKISQICPFQNVFGGTTQSGLTLHTIRFSLIFFFFSSLSFYLMSLFLQRWLSTS